MSTGTFEIDSRLETVLQDVGSLGIWYPQLHPLNIPSLRHQSHLLGGTPSVDNHHPRGWLVRITEADACCWLHLFHLACGLSLAICPPCPEGSRQPEDTPAASGLPCPYPHPKQRTAESSNWVPIARAASPCLKAPVAFIPAPRGPKTSLLYLLFEKSLSADGAFWVGVEDLCPRAPFYLSVC